MKEYAEKQRGEVKTHSEKPMAKVARVFPEEGYGFLVTPEGREVYFHENAVLNSQFSELSVGTPVTFTEGAGEEGDAGKLCIRSLKDLMTDLCFCLPGAGILRPASLICAVTGASIPGRRAWCG